VQGVGNAGTRSDHCGLLNAEFHGDRIGRSEADTPDVPRQAIGIFGDQLNGVIAIGLVDTNRPRGANSVGM
jgi:hypothetical protein